MGYDGVGYDGVGCVGVGYHVCVGDEGGDTSMTDCTEGALLNSITFDGNF